MDTITSYKSQIATFERLDAAGEKALALRIKAGDEQAREDLINANLRLVLFVARKFQNRGLSMEDLIMEGNVGLMKAVDKYDGEQGNRFSTYACSWIEQTIRRGIANTAHTIRIPVHVSETMARLAYAKEALHAKMGYEPTAADVAVVVEMDETKVEELMAASHGSLSLDNVAGDEDQTFADLLHAHGDTPDEGAFKSIQRAKVAEMLAKLKDEKEVAVLKFRHGFDENDPHTLEEIGQKLGLTRERVRQIEANALEHLRELVA